MTAEGQEARTGLRSQDWFDNSDDPGMTALYIERYMNWGLTREELQSGRPIIGIAQTGSDLSPCNRHHLELAHRVREGIREMGGIAFEFPVHPIQETGSGQPRLWTATWLTSVLWRSFTVTRSMALS
jgi:dihydroxy-acid dehydratase